MSISSKSVPRIFISHSHYDDEFGRRLVDGLRQTLGDDTAVWYDSAGGLSAGDVWWKKIQQEVIVRPVFIVILSTNAVNSRWVEDEIGMAWNEKNTSPAGKLIIPIIYQPCEVPPAIKMLHSIDFYEREFDVAFQELLATLKLPKNISPLNSPEAVLVEEKFSIIEDAYYKNDRPLVIRESSKLAQEASGAVSSAIYYMQAQALLAEGTSNIERAIVAFSSALAVESDSEQRSKILGELATIHASQGKWQQVLQYVREALQLDPKSRSLRELKAQAHIQSKAFSFYKIYALLALWVRIVIGQGQMVLKFIITILALCISSLGQLIIGGRKRTLFIGILIVAVIFSGVLVYGRVFSSPDTNVIRIGVDLPLSGEDSGNGVLAACGVEYAFNKAAISGYKLELVVRDEVQSSKSISKCANIQSVTATSSACNQNGGVPDPCIGLENITAFSQDALVAGVIGPFDSNIAVAEMPAANKAPLAMISPSTTSPCLTKNASKIWCGLSKYQLSQLRPTGKVTYFRVVTTDDYQGLVAADYLLALAPHKTAYIVDDQEVYGIGLADAFSKEWQRLGGKIIDHVSDQNPDDYSALLQKMDTPPDVIYFAGKDVTGGETFYNILKLNSLFKNTFYAGGDGLINPPQFITIVSPISNPIYATFPGVNVDIQPSAQDFITRYKRLYNDPDLYGKFTVPSYDSASILIQAIKKVIAGGVLPPRNSDDHGQAKIFRQAVINAIQHISYDGIMGHQAFDANGDTLNRVISIYQVGIDTLNQQPTWLPVKSVSIDPQVN